MPTPFLLDLLILFGLGVTVVMAFHRLRLPSIVGFLITGVVCGPYGFGLVKGVSNVESLAEIGVILLLFTVGIEFSMQQLLRVRKFLFLGGALQVALTVGATTLGATALQLDWRVALFLGMLVALSSTAIVLRLFADRGETDSPHGQAALGILIFQDICIVPMVLFAPILAGQGTGYGAIAIIAAKAIAFVAAAVFAARYVVPRVLGYVVNTRKRETFLLTIILLCLGTAWASAQVGLSLALGAFIAGLIISESEYSHQALGEILPLREVFNSLFFVSIGMLFDVRTVLANPATVLTALIVVILIKTSVTFVVTFGLGQSLRIAIIAAFGLAQIGEFSFVLSKVGSELGLLNERLDQLFLAVAVGTMAITPALHALAPRLAQMLEHRAPRRWVTGRALPAVTVPAIADPPRDHTIIVGYGVNGRNLARVLASVNIPFVVVEMSPERVRAERKRGRKIIYGDATRFEILEHAGIFRARIIAIGISDATATRSATALVRRMNPSVHIVVRTRYIHEMEPLFALGADEVIPEEFETSIEIFSRVLQRYMVPRDVIDRSIREIRGDGYEMFRSVADVHTPGGSLARYMMRVSLESYRVEPGSAVAGKTLAESELRKSGVTAVAIQPESGEVKVNPSAGDKMNETDVVLLLGTPEELTRAATMFRGPTEAAT
ncbi:MAG: cation:proton antiporter [Gemmatimonadaceae bacterium]